MGCDVLATAASTARYPWDGVEHTAKIRALLRAEEQNLSKRIRSGGVKSRKRVACSAQAHRATTALANQSAFVNLVLISHRSLPQLEGN